MYISILGLVFMYNIHDHPLYLVCPDVLRTVDGTSFGVQVWFIKSHTVFTIFLIIYLLIGINLLFSVITLPATSLTPLSYWTASSVSQFLCLPLNGFPAQRSVSNPLLPINNGSPK